MTAWWHWLWQRSWLSEGSHWQAHHAAHPREVELWGWLAVQATWTRRNATTIAEPGHQEAEPIAKGQDLSPPSWRSPRTAGLKVWEHHTGIFMPVTRTFGCRAKREAVASRQLVEDMFFLSRKFVWQNRRREEKRVAICNKFFNWGFYNSFRCICSPPPASCRRPRCPSRSWPHKGRGRSSKFPSSWDGCLCYGHAAAAGPRGYGGYVIRGKPWTGSQWRISRISSRTTKQEGLRKEASSGQTTSYPENGAHRLQQTWKVKRGSTSESEKNKDATAHPNYKAKGESKGQEKSQMEGAPSSTGQEAMSASPSEPGHLRMRRNVLEGMVHRAQPVMEEMDQRRRCLRRIQSQWTGTEPEKARWQKRGLHKEGTGDRTISHMQRRRHKSLQSFWAPSTLQVRKTRREEVMELAKKVCEEGNPVFPFTKAP